MNFYIFNAIMIYFLLLVRMPTQHFAGYSFNKASSPDFVSFLLFDFIRKMRLLSCVDFIFNLIKMLLVKASLLICIEVVSIPSKTLSSEIYAPSNFWLHLYYY